MVAVQAELTQPPFDMPIAESELVSGYMTEYSGFRFLIFFIAEFATVGVFSLIAAVLFLGGWGVPFAWFGWDSLDDVADWMNVAGPLILFTKMMVLSFLIMWVRFSVPRFREDQLQRFAWKFLIPLALANIVVTAILKVAICAMRRTRASERLANRLRGRDAWKVASDGIGKPKMPGLLKGMGVTLKTLGRTVTQGAETVQYPHEKEAPPIRARGVIALREDNCTVCMLCARSCPDWCIYIEGHKTLAPPRRAGGKPRSVSLLDRFDIDFALCMYCGICVEVCPFDALFWSPEYEYSEPRIADLLHDKDEARRVDGDGARGAELEAAEKKK